MVYTDGDHMAADEHMSDIGILYFSVIFCVNIICYVRIGKQNV
jgi:hypothetical protein